MREAIHRVVAMALIETALLLRRRESPETEPVPDIKMDTSVDPSVATRRTLGVILWVGGIFAGREGWVLSIVLALVALAVLHLLFVSLLYLPLPPGLLWRALGR